jgi:ankyrin repeat protein
MPNQTDWILLNETINNYGGEIAKTWGGITEENAHTLYAHKYNEKDLFDFLLSNEHYPDANTVASCIPLFSEENVQLIYDRHHAEYHEILKLLCTDKMILLYEQCHEQCHEQHHEKNIPMEQKTDSDDNIYRTIISRRYEKMINANPPNNIIIELINEFKFLTHACLEGMCIFSTGIKNIDVVTNFTYRYKKYLEFVPLVYRLINEYYLEYVKFQVKTIEDMYGNSFIILMEYYENLKKCITSLPKNYVDYRYKDRSGNNIIFYLIILPLLSEKINKEIYQEFFSNRNEIPLDAKNSDGDTLFHFMASYENDVFLQTLLEWFFIKQESLFENEQKIKLSQFLKIENIYGKNATDIMFEKNNYTMIFRIIDYIPDRAYNKLTNRLIENFDIVAKSTHMMDKIPPTNNIHKIYIDCINYFMDLLYKMKYEILYDLVAYSDCKFKIIKLLEKCSNEIDINQDYYLEWLGICTKNNEFDLFKIILSKYFYNEHDNGLIKYLNGVVTTSGEPLIIIAIKEQKIPFVKYLLNYNIDLLVCDKTNRNSLVVALETKNVYLIRLLREHIINDPIHASMATIMGHFINLLEAHTTFNTFSFADTLSRLWNTIEYIINHITSTFGGKN